MQTDRVVTLTDAAISHIRKNLIRDPTAKGLRLSIKKTGCSGFAYVTDIIKETPETDLHYLFGEDVAVFVEPSAVQFIVGTVIDFVDKGLGQSKLVFNNPNVASLCGCGESFSLSDGAEDE
jgi:iron-sulfur cluster assembly accessory protein